MTLLGRWFVAVDDGQIRRVESDPDALGYVLMSIPAAHWNKAQRLFALDELRAGAFFESLEDAEEGARILREDKRTIDERMQLGAFILGGVFIQGRLMDHNNLTGPHRIIADAMTRCRAADPDASLVELYDELRSAGQLAEVGGASYIAELCEDAPSPLDPADEDDERRRVARRIGALRSVSRPEP